MVGNFFKIFSFRHSDSVKERNRKLMKLYDLNRAGIPNDIILDQLKSNLKTATLVNSRLLTRRQINNWKTLYFKDFENNNKWMMKSSL